MAEATTDVDETTDDTETTDDDWTPPTREEWQAQQDEANRLKRVSAEKDKEARDAKRKAKEAEEAKAREEGDWKKVAEEKEREATEAREEADEAKGKLTKYERQRTVSTAAAALNFADAQDAVVYLTNPESAYYLEPEKFGDDKLVEAALKRLKKDKPALIATTRRSGVDSEYDGADAGLTVEQKHARWLASKF